jgi:hypothetical protein
MTVSAVESLITAARWRAGSPERAALCAGRCAVPDAASGEPTRRERPRCPARRVAPALWRRGRSRLVGRAVCRCDGVRCVRRQSAPPACSYRTRLFPHRRATRACRSRPRGRDRIDARNRAWIVLRMAPGAWHVAIAIRSLAPCSAPSMKLGVCELSLGVAVHPNRGRAVGIQRKDEDMKPNGRTGADSAGFGGRDMGDFPKQSKGRHPADVARSVSPKPIQD